MRYGKLSRLRRGKGRVDKMERERDRERERERERERGGRGMAIPSGHHGGLEAFGNPVVVRMCH